ncbi:MAG: bifunctional DNA primase/polymerase [Bacteroidetes bacterium]|nr:bifunctional DNA primase/polymerase [Bacteroidota bacterium]
MKPLEIPDPFPTNTSAAADIYRDSALLVCIDKGEKSPKYQGWQKGLPPDQIKDRFSRPSNIGLILGAVSGGLIDVDLDCDEAVALAPSVLTSTVQFGRKSRPNSHCIYYVTDEDLKRTAFKDAANGEMMVEIRGSGAQTVFPPSIHPSGEQVLFESFGVPRLLPAETLREQVKLLAALTQLARAWPRTPGVRHDLAQALVGGLLRDGMTPDGAERVVQRVAKAAGDEEAAERGKGAERVAARIMRDEQTTGWPKVVELLGPNGSAVVKAVRTWMGLEGSSLFTPYARPAQKPKPTAKTTESALPGPPLSAATNAPRPDTLALVRSLQTATSAAQVYDLSSGLATLAPDQYAKVKTELKGRWGEALNLNDLDRAVGAHRTRQPVPIDPHGRPTLVVTDYETHLDCLEAVTSGVLTWNDTSVPRLYQQAGHIVCVEEDGGRPRTELLDAAKLRYYVDQALNFVRKTNGGGFAHSRCPEDLVRDLEIHLARRLPPLKLVSEIPLVRPDGTILDTPGYDVDTGVLYRPAASKPVRVPQTVTDADVSEAVRLLVDELLGDFPFDTEASRANALAYLLTLFLRLRVPGPYPLALIDATKRGTGKGLLVDAISMIATKRFAPKTALPQSEDEVRKQVTSILLGSPTIAAFDNVDRPIRSGVLESMLTAAEWNDRLLGRSQQMTLANQTVWCMTGNNLLPQNDLPRRSYLIRMDARTARPNERSRFRHPDLLGWVSEHLPDLQRAVLVLIRAWTQAGCPDAGGRAMGSYQPWAQAVAGILNVAGIPGFLGNTEQLLNVADDDTEWEPFLEALWETYGEGPFLARDVAALIMQEGHGGNSEALRAATPDYLLAMGDRSDSQFSLALGSAFKRRRGERFGKHGLRVEHDAGRTKGVQRWIVRRDH